MAENQNASTFGKEFNLIYELILTGRKAGADHDFYATIAHDTDLLRQIVEAVKAMRERKEPIPKKWKEADKLIYIVANGPVIPLASFRETLEERTAGAGYRVALHFGHDFQLSWGKSEAEILTHIIWCPDDTVDLEYLEKRRAEVRSELKRYGAKQKPIQVWAVDSDQAPDRVLLRRNEQLVKWSGKSSLGQLVSGILQNNWLEKPVTEE